MDKNNVKKGIRMSDIVKAAEEAKKNVTDLSHTKMSQDNVYSMTYLADKHKKAKGVKNLIDTQTEVIKKLKNRCSTLNNRLRTTKAAACLALAIASGVSALAGYNFAEHRLNQEKFIIENSNYSNPYDYHKFFDNTDIFLKMALKDQILRVHPDREHTISNSIVESFNDTGEYGVVDVNLIYEPNMIDKRRSYSYSVALSPELQKIYDTQLELQKLSLSVPEDEQDTIGFYKDVNALIQEQKDNLLEYKNKDNKSLEQSAKEILDDSSVSYDDER